MDEDFTLTGTPRFADRVHAPPFHWNCRTAIALVPRRYVDDELTGQMRSAAWQELDARQEAGGERVEVHPAHARSRR
jgi:hypothetical protein